GLTREQPDASLTFRSSSRNTSTCVTLRTQTPNRLARAARPRRPEWDRIPCGPVPTVVHGDFEWDPEKALANVSKHGVTFEEAAVAMTDPMAVDFDDAKYPDRLITVARSPRDRILYVVTTESGTRIRIISARRATPNERRIYEEGD